MNEFYLQATICDYLNRIYPDVLYRSDLAGVKMTIGQAKKIKMIQQERGWPDLIIYEVSTATMEKYEILKKDSTIFYYLGLALEIKCENEKLYKKNGQPKSKHIEEQLKILKKLRERNYFGTFGIGFDHCKDIIDHYLKCKVNIF